MSRGLSEQESDDLIVRAVDLTCEARQQFLDANPDSSLMPIVAASMGPYGAMLHNGSEYTGHYDIDETGLRNFHKTRLQLLDHTNADVLAFETIPNKLEARVLCDLLTNVRLPAWVSFSCRDERRISDGTRLQDASAIFRKHPRVLAVGVNCTAPRLISSLIQEAREGVPDKAIIVYPNSGETYDVTTNTWCGTANPDEVATAAQIWRSEGAKIIGGCCRIGPRHIDTLRRQLAS